MNNTLKKYITLTLIVCSVTACKKELDLNKENPNGITSTQISGKDVFANALQGTSGNITNAYSFANEWMGYWARTTSYSQAGQGPIENFALQNSQGDGIWQSEYHNIFNYNFVISNSTKSSILPGASMVMKALVFQNLVDLFGDVPYTQAALPDVTTKPKYDTALTIYKSLISDINTGIAAIKASSTTTDDVADIMFKGDKTKWIHFANTLKLRILMRMVPNGDQAFVKSALADIASEGSGFLQAGEDAVINPGFADATGQQNPFWTSYGHEVGVNGAPKANFVFFIANKTMIDYLNATSDPRIAYLYDTTKGKNSGNYLGAIATANPTSTLATIGKGILQSASQPGIILLATQSYFLQAEAAYRGLISGSYSSFFKTAMEESFRYLTVPNPVASADSYFTTSTDDRVNPAVGTNPLKAIGYQKWVALAEVDGLESWAEYRRTGFPDRTQPSISTGVSSANNVLPKRFLYPQSEYNLNSANVNAENQGITGYTVKIFWGQ